MSSWIRTYSELISIPTFEERLEYLELRGRVGEDTFGSKRYLNQVFYKSPEWKSVRNKVILRDYGRDLAMEGYEIHGKILIHHINPIDVSDIVERTGMLFDLENLVCVSHQTHEDIHYGNSKKRIPVVFERKPNDTIPWKRNRS